MDVKISGAFAYVAEVPRWDGFSNVGGGLRILDISNPSHPTSIGLSGNSGAASAVAIDESHAYVAYLESGLEIIDIGDPINPQRLGGYPNTRGHAAGVAVSGKYVYLSEGRFRNCIGRCWFDGDWGLYVIGVSDPANPFRVGQNKSFAESRDSNVRQAITIANGKIFLALESQELSILNLYQPIRLERIVRASGGAIQLWIAGPPGVPGHLQRSSDLHAWADWMPLNFGESRSMYPIPTGPSCPVAFIEWSCPEQ